MQYCFLIFFHKQQITLTLYSECDYDDVNLELMSNGAAPSITQNMVRTFQINRKHSPLGS